MIRTNLTSRFDDIARTLDEKLDTVVRLGAETIETEAQARVPVESGNLRDSIHVEKEDDASYRVVAGDSDVWYGHIVENGSVYKAPRPFLLPAFESRKDDITDSLKRELRGL